MGSAAGQWSPSESVTVDRSRQNPCDEKSLLDQETNNANSRTSLLGRTEVPSGQSGGENGSPEADLAISRRASV